MDVRYRAWDRNLRAMLEVTGITYEHGCVVEVEGYTETGLLHVTVSDFVLMPAYGIPDAHGNTVYAGDVMRTGGNHSLDIVVAYGGCLIPYLGDCNGWYFRYNGDNAANSITREHMAAYHVIGDIYRGHDPVLEAGHGKTR